VPPQSEPRVERRLAAIFAADVAGYSRLMSQDEAGTLRALAAAREIMDGLIAEHGGRIANTAGDSVLAGLGRLLPMHVRIGVFISGSASTWAM
jgi:adenylate cyclase